MPPTSRTPTHPGLLLPRLPPPLVPMTDGSAVLLQEVLGATAVWRLGEGRGAGNYVAEREGERVLVKLADREQAARLVRADRLLGTVEHGGLQVPRLLPGFPVGSTELQLEILAYPYVHGRYPSSSPADVTAVARALSHLHAGLRRLPVVACDEVREAAGERQAHRARTLSRALRGDLPLGPDPEGVLALLRRYGADALVEDDDAQVVHGDAIPGNLLLREGGRVVLLDHEELPCSWATPFTDLCTVLERLVLAAVPEDEAALGVLTGALAEYGEPVRRAGHLVQVMLRRNVQALLALAAWAGEGGHVDPLEWRKFPQLVGVLEARTPLLDAAERISGRAGGSPS